MFVVISADGSAENISGNYMIHHRSDHNMKKIIFYLPTLTKFIDLPEVIGKVPDEAGGHIFNPKLPIRGRNGLKKKHKKLKVK